MKTPIDPNKEYNFVGKVLDENGKEKIESYVVLGKDLTEEHIKAIKEAEDRIEKYGVNG